MSDIAIRAENLGKKYRIGAPVLQYRTLRDALGRLLRRPDPQERDEQNGSDTIWALNNVSFDVRQGQVLGVIGRNGAGKSTLLKILSRVTDPTTGYAEIHGRVGSLLEVGTGFHPELSGRDNIYLNGAILGMKRTEIDQKFDEIVHFSEVEKFIDTPVKRYSSGMYLRLAFAVAAHLEPEILVVDEVLAVGDAEFQRKCLGKMNEVANQGRTVLFVSHNMTAILRLTEETMVIDHGQLALRAPTAQAVDYYLSRSVSQEGECIWDENEIPADSAPFKPVAVRLRSKDGKICDTVRSIEPFMIDLEYQLDKPVVGLRVGIYLLTTRGEFILTSFDTDDPGHFDHYRQRNEGRYLSRCVVPANFLNEGRFVIGVNASAYRIKRYFQDDQALSFNVDGAGAPGNHWPEPRLGSVRPLLEWSIEDL